MCIGKLFPKVKSSASQVMDPNAGRAAAEAELRARRASTGFSGNMRSTSESRSTGSVASKLLFGQ
jgi:hypothetical protein